MKMAVPDNFDTQNNSFYIR